MILGASPQGSSSRAAQRSTVRTAVGAAAGAVFVSSPTVPPAAAGAMIWMVGRELLPEALARGPRRTIVADAAIAFALMLALQLRLTA